MADLRHAVHAVVECYGPDVLGSPGLFGAALARAAGDDAEARDLLACCDARYLAFFAQAVALGDSSLLWDGARQAARHLAESAQMDLHDAWCLAARTAQGIADACGLDPWPSEKAPSQPQVSNQPPVPVSVGGAARPVVPLAPGMTPGHSVGRSPSARSGWWRVLGALMVIAGVVAAEIVAVLVVVMLDISDESLWSSIIPEALGMLAVIGGFVLMGGHAWIKPTRDDVPFTFRFGWWCLAVSLGLMALELTSYLFDGTPLSASWLPRLLESALLCLLIGVFEEFMFRGVVFNALLAVMGSTHRGVVRAVLITSLLFGLAHVDLTTDFNSAIQAVQAVLKIAQTGMYSLLLCVIVLRTRRLWGASLFHGIDDFVLVFPSVALFDEPLSTEYVVTGEDAVPAIMYYLVVIALYIPFVIKAWRELQRGQDVYRGVFEERQACPSLAPEVVPMATATRGFGAVSAPTGPAAGGPPTPGGLDRYR